MRFVKSALVFLFALFLSACLTPASRAISVRNPAVSGTFYPASESRLKEMIKGFVQKARHRKPKLSENRRLTALVMPHAGYVYSGPVAAYVAFALSGKKFDKVIVMGPDHYVGFSGAAVSDADAYLTPLGLVPIHPDAALLKKKYPFFKSSPESDKREHSIEVILPFLQVFLPKFELVPVVMGPYDVNAYLSAIDSIRDEHTLIVVSTDLSHYLPYDEAVRRDTETINAILGLDMKRLTNGSNRACGIFPLMVLINLARRHHWIPILLDRANSGDTAGNRDRVVGYAAIAFYGEKIMPDTNETGKGINPEKGIVLLELARKTIAQRLGVPYIPSADLEKALKDPFFSEKRGTFVTLTINGRLRGCIGNIAPDRSIASGVTDNAVNAAFQDPRFSPLTPDEFKKIHIEVSLLTEPKPLDFNGPDDLLAKIRPGIDGLIIRKGIYSATFLPQVWDQLPDKRDFLGHLCLKAGLPENEWRKPGLKVFTYQVQYVEEKEKD